MMLELLPVGEKRANMPDVKHRWQLFCEVGVVVKGYSSRSIHTHRFCQRTIEVNFHNTPRVLELVYTIQCSITVTETHRPYQLSCPTTPITMSMTPIYLRIEGNQVSSM